jgi:hypothetical protein
MDRKWCTLTEIASVGLGFKSLQNQFFYLDQKTISLYGIEREYLSPLFRLKDLDSKAFLQVNTPSVYLFSCDRPESDIRGTKTLSYIRVMASRPASAKKQAGEPQSIREALSAQGGTYWYAPKASPHNSHIWLRKAFDSIYAPFLFETSVPFDQRCNYISPRKGISWKLVAAVMTSSLFALALESYGSASMGAGALEVPTKKLRELRVVDVRKFSKKDC